MFVLWQRQGAKWTRATNPVPLREAERMRDAAIASGRQVEYRVLREDLTP